MPIKPIKKTISINPADLEYTKTGEPVKKMFDSDTLVRVTKVEDTNRSEVSYDRYIVFDSKASDYIRSVLNNTEYGHTIIMAQEISAPYNALKKKGTKSGPSSEHSSESLQELLGLSRTSFYSLIRRLVKKGILAYAVCAPVGIVKKVYLLNPTIARRSKDFDNAILALFPDFS